MNMARPRFCFSRIYWRTPTTLLGSFVAAIAIAIAHHQFYQSLDRTNVSSEPFDVVRWKVSRQQVVAAAGTALAFLFKASLVLSTAIAYFQLFMRAIFTGSFSLRRLDNWFSGLSDLGALFSIATYVKHPLLALIAVTAWLLPIAAIVSPAALSITFDQLQPAPVSLQAVPQPAFDSLAFEIFEGGPSEYGTLLISTGPNRQVPHIVTAVSSGGSILPIQPPGTNASWQMTFEGPSLSCSNIDENTRDEIKQNLLNTLAEATTPMTNMDNATIQETRYQFPSNFMFSYLAWMNFTTGNLTQRLPFNGEVLNDLATWLSVTGQAQPVSLSMAVFPRAVSYLRTANATQDSHGTFFDAARMDWYFQDATLLNCELGAAIYTLNFTYSNQQQFIQIVSKQPLIPDPYSSSRIELVTFNESSDGELGITCLGLMNPLRGGHCLRYWSYNSIWHSFVSMLFGASNPDGSYSGYARLYNRNQSTPTYYQTQVFSTILAETQELAQLVTSPMTAQNITNMTSGALFDQGTSILPPKDGPSEDRKPLKIALEELFFNITISMASSDALLYNESSPLAPPKVNVTQHLYGNMYDYSPSKLWIPYGIAIGITVLNVSLGLCAILKSGQSFSPNFSTVAALVRAATFEPEVDQTGWSGADPLPKHIAKIQFNLKKDANVLGKNGFGSVYGESGEFVSKSSIKIHTGREYVKRDSSERSAMLEEASVTADRD